MLRKSCINTTTSRLPFLSSLTTSSDRAELSQQQEEQQQLGVAVLCAGTGSRIGKVWGIPTPQVIPFYQNPQQESSPQQQRCSRPPRLWHKGWRMLQVWLLKAESGYQILFVVSSGAPF